MAQAKPTSSNLFFSGSGLELSRAQSLVSNALKGADDGELYLEYNQSESFVFDDGRLKSASFNQDRGFGLRAVQDEATGYAHSSELSEAAIRRAADAVSAVKSGHDGQINLGPKPTPAVLYHDQNPLLGHEFTVKTDLLAQIDAYARALDRRVVQVSASIFGEWSAITILRADGQMVEDVRPLVRLNVSIVVEDQHGRRESGSYGVGGRQSYDTFIRPEAWQKQVNEALRQALVNLESTPAPAGVMSVVLGSGWPGIMLHEAVGHGLEGDFNRKKTSAFAGLLGEQVAAKGVTVIDDGTIPDRRGSLSIDDEGTPTERTVLIEDGKLVGYMQDRLNARLMGMAVTGNGRRQSYAHQPMPRMTNTYMLGGTADPAEIIQSVENGIYAVNFGGGQVDTTSGKFVFSCTEAYRIEKGKVTAPVKGATLIGNGPEALKHVKMIGNDMALDSGIGTCGKAGQGVPVGVGQPTLLIEGLTVGGTAA